MAQAKKKPTKPAKPAKPSEPDPGASSMTLRPIDAAPPQELSQAGGGKDQYPAISTRAFQKQELKTLNRDFKDEEIELRSHDGAMYAPAIRFQDRFDEAFGQGKWGLKRTTAYSDPAQSKGVVMATFHLYVEGRFVCEATGAQRYIETNREMDFGDAIEGCQSNALMRCGKHVGVGRKLWDPNFRRKWLAEHAIQVTVIEQRNAQQKTLWRRKDAAPFTGKFKEIAAEAVKQPRSRPATVSGPPIEDVQPPLDNSGAFEEKDVNAKVVMRAPSKKAEIDGKKKLVHQFQFADEAKNVFWAVTTKDEIADVANTAMGAKSEVHLKAVLDELNKKKTWCITGLEPILEG